jgi:uncharacterized protein (TIGR02996 family)
VKQEAKELHRFMSALTNDPRDVTTRRIFADWLDDHDEPELAGEQRAWSLKKYDAEQFLKKFAENYYYGTWQEMVKRTLSGEMCFSSDSGPEEARTNEFWEAVEAVSEKSISEEQRDSTRFRCAC